MVLHRLRAVPVALAVFAVVAIAAVSAAAPAGPVAPASAAPVAAAPLPPDRPLPPEPDPAPTPGEYVWDLAYAPDRKTLAVLDGPVLLNGNAQTDRRLTLFDAATHRVVRRVADPAGVIDAYRKVRFAPDGRLVYLASLAGAVHTCDPRTGEVRKRFDAESGLLFGFALSPDGRRFATYHRRGGGPARHAVWDAGTFKLARELAPALGLSGEGVFAPDGKSVAFGFEAKGVVGAVELDPGSGAEVRKVVFAARVPGAKPVAWPAAFSPDGRWVALAGGEAVPVGAGASELRGYVRVWDRQTGVVREVGDGPNDYVRALAVSADGRRLYAATLAATEVRDGRGARWQAGKVQCWDTATWREVWAVETRGGGPTRLAPTPSGRRLWVADRAGLWLLDADTGAPRGGLIESRPF